MTINIALTKGRLEKNAIEIFEKAGLNCESLKNKGRKLVFRDEENDINYFLVKANDAITYVEHGVADLAIVGKDSLMYSGKDYYEILDMKFGVCKFIVAGMPNINLFERVGHVKIASKYPEVATEYFKKRYMDVEVIKIEGSVELAPILGLCDGIVDIMETGTTLKENGLVVLDEVCNISARLIANKVSFKMKQEQLLPLVNLLDKVVR
ncbi:ATP phosphoribosyltransferase [uncultured Clostridium sp.]|jgi:ATP phosphoribosyltransferase|uniref:ATP phosphoribosyltransferase n=1 Tax=uncultured Clostridium sp. TaxID=59620 RepID=UPI002616334D|nr:ATP phosphoribosyltransferase [uncultured Clostridium sp.]